MSVSYKKGDLVVFSAHLHELNKHPGPLLVGEVVQVYFHFGTHSNPSSIVVRWSTGDEFSHAPMEIRLLHG